MLIFVLMDDVGGISLYCRTLIRISILHHPQRNCRSNSDISNLRVRDVHLASVNPLPRPK